MKSLLSNAYYTDPRIFAAEQERLFEKLWLFVGTLPMVKNHLDYRTLEVAGKPLIVQNFNGEVRCFLNVCRHRLSKIHTKESGNGPLVCPYHSWVYNSDGKLTGVPQNDRWFGLSEEDKGELSLRSFQVRMIGQLIFINLGKNPPPVEEQFTPEIYAVLEESSNAMDDALITTCYPVAFNWKLGMENIKDTIHPYFVHKETFPAGIRNENKLAARNGIQANFRDVPPDLRDSSDLGESPIDPPLVFEWQSSVQHLPYGSTYRTVHLFPNVNYIVVSGTSVSIQTYHPVAPGQTRLEMMVTLTKPTKPISYKPAVLWEHLRSDYTVLREDISCLENLQKGITADEGGILHGDYEYPIVRFHQHYLNALRDGAAG